ncbi:hypothetical protein K402DRAFT_404730 [Aulographum hederae CBS 113979]|uniref:Uncharacterized protein n=1 Tax=Aulographum hederae CBS 113979 TaxID=1176131 RepID=A0A6G1GY99_9PEZI|nr:hypothetical protein K402DRAFT_404730 [Aulographum hederae CBS 113979]
MASSEVGVAIVALVVSLIALLVAAGQLSHQYLSTAEGYRRCRKEVIGPWAARTHRRWLWSEFRYETTSTTPQLDLLSAVQYRGKKTKFRGTDRGPYHVVADIEFMRQLHLLETWWRVGYDGKCCAAPEPNNLSLKRRDPQGPLGFQVDAVPSFDDYMASMQEYQPTDVFIVYRTLSWDFMPSDVECTTDSLRASGNGHSISSTVVRGLGIVIQYSPRHGSPKSSSMSRGAQSWK